MNGRHVAILGAVALVVFGAGAWLASREGSRPDSLGGGRVLPDLRDALNDVTEIRVQKGDGSKVTVRRTDAEWQVVEREYPADASRVRQLLMNLAQLEVVEEKTSDPGNYAQLGVEDVAGASNATGSLVEAVTPQKTFALIVGKPSGGSSSFVRVAGESRSFLAKPQLSVDADPARWVDRTIVDLPQKRIREMVVTPARGNGYTLRREKSEDTDFELVDVPKGREPVGAGALNAVPGSLASLTLDDVRRVEEKKPDDGRSRPRAIVRTFDGLELEITGREEDSQHYLTLSAKATQDEAREEAERLSARFAGREYEIPGYKYDALFRPLDQLLVPKS